MFACAIESFTFPDAAYRPHSALILDNLTDVDDRSTRRLDGTRGTLHPFIGLSLLIGDSNLESVNRSVVNPMLSRPKLLFVLIFLVAAGLGSILPADAMRLLTIVSELHEMPPPPRPGYRAPDDPETLFYLQRSTNANTIVYAANIDAQGRFDPHNPVEVFWRVFDEDGRRHGLNWIERLLAYGVRVQPAKGVPNAFDAYVVSFPQMKCRVDMSPSGKPECIVEFDGRRARLVSAYIELDESGMWPRPLFLNIYGIDTKSGSILREHFEPAPN